MACNRKLLVHIFDVVIAFTWVSHFNIVCWRGTWTLTDYYVLPSQPILSAFVTAIGGTMLRAFIKCLIPLLNTHVTKKNRVVYTIVSRAMFYLLIIGTITQWRGIWYLLDIAMGTGWKSNAITLIITMLTQWLLKCSSNMVYTPPMVIGYDEKDDLFQSNGRWQVEAKRPWLYVLDIWVSEIFIGSLVVSGWRAVWNIYNDVVFPDNFILSNLLTWGVGNILCILVVVVQKYVADLSTWCAKHSKGWTFVLEEVYLIPCILGVIAVWRGWWNILEVELLPDPFMGGWICHGVGCLALLCTGMLSSVYDQFYLVDGQTKSGRLYWPQQFISCILEQREIERTSKEIEVNETEKEPIKDSLFSKNLKLLTDSRHLDETDNKHQQLKLKDKNVEMGIKRQDSQEDLSLFSQSLNCNNNIDPTNC